MVTELVLSRVARQYVTEFSNFGWRHWLQILNRALRAWNAARVQWKRLVWERPPHMTEKARSVKMPAKNRSWPPRGENREKGL